MSTPFPHDIQQILTLFDSASLAVWGPFFLLLLCGLGLPVPEDIILVSAGFLAAENGKPFWWVAAVMYVGIVLGDLIIYMIGRFFTTRLINSRLGKYLLPEERMARVKSHFAKHGTAVLFFGRFIPGLRAPIYMTAGTVHYSFWKFLFLDGLAALISSPIFVYIGHWAHSKFADDIDALRKQVGHTKLYLLIGIACVGLIVLLVYRFKAAKRQSEAKKIDIETAKS